jgi:purine-binding chemotaxis protein CheW
MSSLTRGPGRAIDWEALRERLFRSESLAQERLSPERARQVLQERAEALARVPAAATPGESVTLVFFDVGGERYAVEARHVREVVSLRALTAVPGVPDYIRGIFNLRGSLLMVVDLCRLFGLTTSGLGELTKVVVLGTESQEFGVLADRVDKVEPVYKEELREPSEAVVSGAGRHFQWVTPDGRLVLDGRALLADERLYIDQPAEDDRPWMGKEEK